MDNIKKYNITVMYPGMQSREFKMEGVVIYSSHGFYKFTGKKINSNPTLNKEVKLFYFPITLTIIEEL